LAEPRLVAAEQHALDEPLSSLGGIVIGLGVLRHRLLLRTGPCEDSWCGLKLHRLVFGKYRRSRERCRAHDVRLNNNVGPTADDQKMLNVITTGQDQSSPSVHRSRIDRRQSGRLAPTPARSPFRSERKTRTNHARTPIMRPICSRTIRSPSG
jgi:hypothetical protein